MFQPVPAPVASPTSNAWDAVTFWSAPLRVAAKLAVAGLETSARLPAVMAADADVVAPAGAAMLTTPSAAIANPVAARRRKCERDRMILSPCCRNVDCEELSRGNRWVALSKTGRTPKTGLDGSDRTELVSRRCGASATRRLDHAHVRRVRRPPPCGQGL